MNMFYYFSKDQMMETQRPEEVMESNTNIEDWRLEVERVLPHLKVTVRNGT